VSTCNTSATSEDATICLACLSTDFKVVSTGYYVFSSETQIPYRHSGSTAVKFVPLKIIHGISERRMVLGNRQDLPLTQHKDCDEVIIAMI
jgi:hypothetical protein